MMIADRLQKRLDAANRRREAALRAIAKHASRVKDGRSHFTVDEHMDAIQGLANLGLANIGGNANMRCESES